MVEESKSEDKRERELDLGKNIYWTDEVKIRINDVIVHSSRSMTVG